jgi:hypothetical protein
MRQQLLYNMKSRILTSPLIVITFAASSFVAPVLSSPHGRRVFADGRRLAHGLYIQSIKRCMQLEPAPLFFDRCWMAPLTRFKISHATVLWCHRSTARYLGWSGWVGGGLWMTNKTGSVLSHMHHWLGSARDVSTFAIGLAVSDVTHASVAKTPFHHVRNSRSWLHIFVPAQSFKAAQYSWEVSGCLLS